MYHGFDDQALGPMSLRMPLLHEFSETSIIDNKKTPRLIRFAILPRILYTRNISLKHSRRARLVKLCCNKENVSAPFSSGPSGITIRKKGVSLMLSFYLSVYDSLPLGGFVLRTSATVFKPLKAPSAMPYTIT
jgi:hypothetical protein